MVADALAIDHQIAVIDPRSGRDGVEQQRGGVIPVRPERRRGSLAVGRLVGGEEVDRALAGALVDVLAEALVRTGEVHAPGLG